MCDYHHFSPKCPKLSSGIAFFFGKVAHFGVPDNTHVRWKFRHNVVNVLELGY